MKRIARVTVLADWQPSDAIQVYIGQENAADLAASDSVKRVARMKVGNAAEGSVVEIAFEYAATDICATLPIGVSVIDEAGNESDKLEALLQLADPPDPPGRPNVSATANPGEATLAWLASADL